MVDYFGTNLFSLAFEDEATFGVTADSSWTVILATRPEITFGREIEDLGLSVGADFVRQQVAVGSRHGGTFSFSVPLRGQLDTYNDPTDSLTQNPEQVLLEDVMGAKHTGTSAATDVAAASTAALWKFTASTPDEGAFYYTADAGAETVDSMGWVTDLSTNDATIFNDSRTIPTVGDDLYGCYTYYSDGSTPTSKSFRYKGESDDHDVFLKGCIPQGCVITMGSGKIPTAEFTYMFTSWGYQTASGDGLLTATDYNRLPPIIGINQGRVMLTQAQTGTANSAGWCGVGDLQVEIGLELSPLECHSGVQGYSDIIVSRRTARLGFTLPFLGSYVAGGEFAWDTLMEAGTPISVQVDVGSSVGEVFSILVPAAGFVEQAQLGDHNNRIGFSIAVEPEDYTGDTGSTAPANSSFRIAMG